MNRRMILGLTVVGLLTAGSAVRADTLTTDYHWGYRFVSDNSPYQVITNHNAVGVISLPENGSYTAMKSAAGYTTQISTPIYSWSTALAKNSQTVNSVPFAVNLKLINASAHLGEYVSFGGVLNGNIWNKGSTISPTFLSPLTQTINIDHLLYTVSFAGFSAPQGEGHPGSVRFNVTVHHNPEPSSLVLAGIGVPLFGYILRRRQRASA